MKDTEIVELYWQRSERAVEESERKYGAYCRTVAYNILENSEEAVLLHHMILSHHGHYEFGSPVLPMLQEAEVLCLIDNMDARMNTLKSALDQVKPGMWTSKLFALENRQFYKPKGSE